MHLRSRRLIVVAVAAALAGLGAGSAFSQADPHRNVPRGDAPGANPHAPRGNPHWVEPSPDARRRAGPNRSLDFLFGALKAAPDDDSAKSIEDRIWARWLASGSDTVTLLMSRAKAAVESNDLDLAVRLLDAVVELRPKYVEAWNRRATVFFLKKDYASALADMRKVLALEPRHFGALAGLGMIMQEIGDDRHALEAYRRAAELYPRLKGMDDKIKSLSEKVEGRKT
jgi:tetratricopeptide (TPR) repeat protein